MLHLTWVKNSVADEKFFAVLYRLRKQNHSLRVQELVLQIILCTVHNKIQTAEPSVKFIILSTIRRPSSTVHIFEYRPTILLPISYIWILLLTAAAIPFQIQAFRVYTPTWWIPHIKLPLKSTITHSTWVDPYNEPRSGLPLSHKIIRPRPCLPRNYNCPPQLSPAPLAT